MLWKNIAFLSYWIYLQAGLIFSVKTGFEAFILISIKNVFPLLTQRGRISFSTLLSERRILKLMAPLFTLDAVSMDMTWKEHPQPQYKSLLSFLIDIFLWSYPGLWKKLQIPFGSFRFFCSTRLRLWLSWYYRRDFIFKSHHKSSFLKSFYCQDIVYRPSLTDWPYHRLKYSWLDHRDPFRCLINEMRIKNIWPFRVFRGCKGWPPALSAISKKCKLRNDKHFPGNVWQRTVHLSLFIFEDS